MGNWTAMYITPKNAPCKNCTDRAQGCHGSCTRYAEYMETCKDIRKQRQLRREVNQAIGDAMKRIPGKREV